MATILEKTVVNADGETFSRVVQAVIVDADDTAADSVETLLSGVTVTGAGAVVALPRGSFPRVISAKVVGTGAVSATVEIWGRAGTGGDNLLMTFTLSGTTSDNDGAVLEAPWPEIWADVTAISGTGAAVTVTTGY